MEKNQLNKIFFFIITVQHFFLLKPMQRIRKLIESSYKALLDFKFLTN